MVNENSIIFTVSVQQTKRDLLVFLIEMVVDVREYCGMRCLSCQDIRVHCVKHV